MFQSRVSGVGISTPTAEETRKDVERTARMAPALREYQRKFWAWSMGLGAARSKCPPIDPNIRYIQAPICQPILDYKKANPEPTPPEGATHWELTMAMTTPPSDTSDVIVDGLVPASTPKPAGSGFPLLIGAALLLLS